MAKYDYNIVSIGAGSAGLVTSYIGAILKAKVALIERHKMGGDCLNTGCVPSKALIKTAKVIQSFKKHIIVIGSMETNLKRCYFRRCIDYGRILFRFYRASTKNGSLHKRSNRAFGSATIKLYRGFYQNYF